MEGISHQFASLTSSTSAEPKTSNRFEQDVSPNQVNSLNMIRKPAYNPYSNSYNSGWRAHPKFAWSQGFQQNGTSSQRISQPPQPAFRQFNQNFLRPNSWDKAIKKLAKSTQAAIDQQN